METQPAVQQNRDDGRFSNSDVEVDSPFASKSLPKEVLPSCLPSGFDPGYFILAAHMADSVLESCFTHP